MLRLSVTRSLAFVQPVAPGSTTLQTGGAVRSYVLREGDSVAIPLDQQVALTVPTTIYRQVGPQWVEQNVNTVQYIEAGANLRLRPRVQGDRVTVEMMLEVAGMHATPQTAGYVPQPRTTAPVMANGLVGEWLPLDGSATVLRDARGSSRVSTAASSQTLPLYVRVEIER